MDALMRPFDYSHFLFFLGLHLRKLVVKQNVFQPSITEKKKKKPKQQKCALCVIHSISV